MSDLDFPDKEFVRKIAAETVGFYSREAGVLDTLTRLASETGDDEIRIFAEQYKNKLDLFGIAYSVTE